jgi:hypothetical protein
MALDNFATNLQHISRNAAKLSAKLGEFVENTESFRNIIVSRIFGEAQQILIHHVTDAATVVDEYRIPQFYDMLYEVFSDPRMLVFTNNGLDLMSRAMIVAGNWADLREGIDYARERLISERSGNYRSLDYYDALVFWTHRIYRPAREGLTRPTRFKKNIGEDRRKTAYDYSSYGARTYARTIEYRIEGWRNKAPFWLWLNFGSSGGYPEHSGTHFIEAAEREINALYVSESVRLTREFTDAVGREVQQFLLNPQSYQPGQELSRFEFGEQQFVIGVSPTKEISIRSS